MTPSPLKKTAESSSSDGLLEDVFGHEIPEAIRDSWAEAKSFYRNHSAKIIFLQAALECGLEDKSPAFLKVPKTLPAEIGHVIDCLLASMLPYTVCPACQAHNPEKCRLCKETGWITKFMWDSPVITPTTRKLWGKKK